jgi:hypothetical protein
VTDQESTTIDPCEAGAAPVRRAAGRTTPGPVVLGVTLLLGVLGVVLTAGALYGAHRMHGPARIFALVAAAVAALSVLTATGVLLARLLTVPGGSRLVRRPWGTVVAGGVLAIAFALSGTAVAVAVIGPTATDVPRLSVVVVRTPDGVRTVRVDATVGGLPIGSPVALTLTALAQDSQVLGSTVQRTSGDASDTVRLTTMVPANQPADSVQVDVSLTGRVCRAIIPVTAAVRAENVKVSCKPA